VGGGVENAGGGAVDDNDLFRFWPDIIRAVFLSLAMIC